jgi:hypothetical protein
MLVCLCSAAGTILALTLIRLVVNSFINCPKSPKKLQTTHKIRNNEPQEEPLKLAQMQNRSVIQWALSCNSNLKIT